MKTADPPAAPAAPAQAPSPFPPALLTFMTRGWRPARRRLPPRVRGLARFAARRQALSAHFAGEALIVPTGHEKVRANDTNFRFRPGSDFYYLTGNLEADCVLVLTPRARGGHAAVLFVEPNPGRRDPTFFTDRVKGEFWVGPRLGIPESKHRYGVDQCLPLAELPAFLTALTQRSGPPTRLIRGIDPDCDRAVPARDPADAELAAHLGEMRLIKDSLELAALGRACAATGRGFEDVIARLQVGQSEREVEGIFNLRARVEGNDVGYNTIAAAGHHACVLHWTQNDGPLRRGDLLLLDAGVEGNELYTADVTRTLPISGTFSPAQREVYEVVLAAQAAGFAAVRPGNDFMAANRAAMDVLAAALVHWGILPSLAVALDPETQHHRRYTLHNVSHMLGIDVHDCAQARAQAYRYGALRPGMVLTVEPGLYFQADDLTVPARLRGIGVRIEDDLVVTARGHRILSDQPRAADAVEAWMAAVWRRTAPRGRRRRS